jgi:hypothetical protein
MPMLPLVYFLVLLATPAVAIGDGEVALVSESVWGEDKYAYTPQGITADHTSRTIDIWGYQSQLARVEPSGTGVTPWLWRVTPMPVNRSAIELADLGFASAPTRIRSVALAPKKMLVAAEIASGQDWVALAPREAIAEPERNLQVSPLDVRVEKAISVSGDYVLVGTHQGRGVILRIDSQAKIVWTSFAPDIRVEQVKDVIALSDGGVFVAGSIGFSPTDLHADAMIWLGRYDSDGSLISQQVVPGRHGRLFSDPQRMGVVLDRLTFDGDQQWKQDVLIHVFLGSSDKKIAEIPYGTGEFFVSADCGHSGYLLAGTVPTPADRLTLLELSDVFEPLGKLIPQKTKEKHSRVSGMACLIGHTFVLTSVYSENAARLANQKVGLLAIQ